jgi:hypothetical protein
MHQAAAATVEKAAEEEPAPVAGEDGEETREEGAKGGKEETKEGAEAARAARVEGKDPEAAAAAAAAGEGGEGRGGGGGGGGEAGGGEGEGGSDPVSGEEAPFEPTRIAGDPPNEHDTVCAAALRSLEVAARHPRCRAELLDNDSAGITALFAALRQEMRGKARRPVAL